MTDRISLLERKRLQWMKEREEMGRLGGSWCSLKIGSPSVRTTIRTYPTELRTEIRDKRMNRRSYPSDERCASTISLQSLQTESSNGCFGNPVGHHYSSDNLVDLQGRAEMSPTCKTDSILPPIYSNNHQQDICRDLGVDFGMEARYQAQKSQRQYFQQRQNDRHEGQKVLHHYGSSIDEREGETSGYASDSVEAPVPIVPSLKSDMSEKIWQNPYSSTPENSLPPSRMISNMKMGELNRPRWGSVWGQDPTRGDPPPPSWLARLGHSSQVLVINHDSASSPDSSTTDSTGSDTNRTYLRGQNVPIDADILQERESRRLKALELQNAIKQQLEEQEKKKKEERDRQFIEERLEEERIKRERERDQARYEEEQRRIKEKEEAKLKQEEAMRDAIKAAERSALEKKRNARKRLETKVSEEQNYEPKNNDTIRVSENKTDRNLLLNSETDLRNSRGNGETKIIAKTEESKTAVTERDETLSKEEQRSVVDKSLGDDSSTIQLPIGKEVAIVLSGRLENSEILNKANLQLVNLAMTASPRIQDENANGLALGFNALILAKTPRKISPRTETRLLTPSKYRTKCRDFGTQTDIKNYVTEENNFEVMKNTPTKDKKETYVEKKLTERSSNTGQNEELTMKNNSRSKSQPKATLESRPRWNANRHLEVIKDLLRPGIRYRTQSEKDPHYQRRLRLRRQRVDSSDERSRSSSPYLINPYKTKLKTRNFVKRKVKRDNYSDDSPRNNFISAVPLRVDKNGRIVVDSNVTKHKNTFQSSYNHPNRHRLIVNSENTNDRNWCEQEILSNLSTLKHNLLMKQLEWDNEHCLVSSTTSKIY